MALRDCLVKAGDGLVQADRRTLVESAQAYQKDGMPQAEAERRAVQDLLDVYEREKTSIERQIAEQYGGGKPAVEKAPQQKSEQRAGPAEEPKPKAEEPKPEPVSKADAKPEPTRASGDKEPGAGTFYSNPFADPQLWAKAAKDAGFALKAVAKAVQDAFGWTVAQSKWLTDTMAEVKDKFQIGTGVHAHKAGVYGNAVVRLYRAVLESSGTDMLAIARRSGSKTMQDLVLKFAHDPANTSGQAETLPLRVEYEWARMASPVARALQSVEDLAKKAGRNPKEAMQQVANLVRNPRNIRQGNPVHDAAAAIRKALDGALKYMRDAGMDVGEVKDGYYPREFDMDVVRREPQAEFEAAAQRAYRETGLDAESARLAANQLWLKLVFGEGSLYGRGVGKPEGNFLEGRVFGKQVDDPAHPLHKFLVHDPRQSIPSYLQRAVRRAELVRVIGDTPEKWDGLRNQMIEEGVSPEAISDLQDFIQTAGGMQGDKGLNRSIMSAVSWLRTLGTLMFLEKATMTSIPEMIMPAIRSGNLLDIHRSIGTTFKALFLKSRGDVKALEELADDLGLLTAHMGGSVMMNRWHGGDFAGKTQTWIMDEHFKMTGLTQYTEATRIAALDIGRVFVRRLAKGSGKLADEYLGEVGIPKAQAEAFRKWLLATNDGLPSAADLRAAPQDMQRLYTTAMRKFEADSIMRPNQTTRPQWMNKPVLGLFGQLQSYNYAFYNHVLKRNVKQAWKAVSDADYTTAERMTLARPLLMLPLLAAMQGLVGEARDHAFGDPDKEMEFWQKVARAFSRGIPVAPIDPILNIVTGAKYQRSTTETVSGPVLGMVGRTADSYVDYFVKNSPNTNTQERAVEKSIYDQFIEPSAAVALSFAYATAPNLPAKMAVAGARQVVGSGVTRNEFIDAVAGEKKTRGGGGDAFASGFGFGFDSVGF